MDLLVVLSDESIELLKAEAQQVLAFGDPQTLPEDLRRLLHQYRYEKGYTFIETAAQIKGVSRELVRKAERGIAIRPDSYYKILAFLKGVWVAMAASEARKRNRNSPSSRERKAESRAKSGISG